MITNKTRRCRSCKKEKDETLFRSSPSGRQSVCKLCVENKRSGSIGTKKNNWDKKIKLHRPNCLAASVKARQEIRAIMGNRHLNYAEASKARQRENGWM